MLLETNNIDVPQHLSPEFFLEAIESGLQDEQLHIEKMTFAVGSEGGDNYCSSIYRVKISYRNRKKVLGNISVIVKNMPINEHNGFLMLINAFLREKIIYLNILPRMEIFMKTWKFGPKCYHTIGNPVRTFVLEDLKASGYTLANRVKGLDETHANLVLSKLGKYHGLSMVLAEKDSSVMRHFPVGILHPYLVDSSVFDGIFANNLAFVTSNVVTQWPGYEAIAEKLRNILPTLKQRCNDLIKPRRGEVLVLNHGDLWVNNMMFKYDDENPEKPCDVVFVDFQMAHYSSPGIDLIYFLNTSLQIDLMKNKTDDLLKTYYQSLQQTLIELGYKNIPTLKDIQHEVKQKAFYGFISITALFPLMAMDKSESKDNSIEAFVDDATGLKKRHLMYASSRVQETLKFSLKRFNELGILD